MCRLHFLTLMTVAVLVAHAAPSNALVIIDNLGKSPSDYSPIDENTGKALNFVLGGAQDYQLTSVTFGLTSGGTTASEAIVSIWSDDASGTPGIKLETLSFSGISGTEHTFTSAGLTLEAGSTYWIALLAEPGQQFDWDYVGGEDNAVFTEVGATHTARVFGTGSPRDWDMVSGATNLIRIDGAIPEPASLGLLAADGLMMVNRRKR